MSAGHPQTTAFLAQHKRRWRRWPRGRYNGKRIVGVQCKVKINILDWCLVWPRPSYGICLGLGPIRIWWSAQYEGQ